MNAINEYTAGLLGLAALWALWFFGIKPYRLDSYRDRLFALRDELFDLAADGKVRFDQRSYTGLRLLLNGMLRYAHRVSTVGLLVAMIRAKIRKAEKSESNAYEDWVASLSQLPDSTRGKLESIHERMYHEFLKQLFLGSVILTSLTVIMFALNVCTALFRRVGSVRFVRINIRRGYSRTLNKVALQTNAKLLETEAYYSEEEDLALSMAN